MSYSTDDATNIAVTYNDRLRPATYEAESAANTVDIHNRTYTYNNDGATKVVDNAVDEKFSQYNDYDFAGRLKRNEFGTVNDERPFNQTIGYDAFNNMTSRSTNTWSFTARSFTAGYQNNRKTSGGYLSGTDYYDTAGNVVQNNAGSESRYWKFDAAGRVSDWTEHLPYNGGTRSEGGIMTFDGDGRIAKRLNRSANWFVQPVTWAQTPEYNIYSSVTGQKITELTQTGQKLHTYVYMGSSVIADQNYGTQNNSELTLKHTDPATGSVMQTQLTGELSVNGTGRVDSAGLGTFVPSQVGEEFPMPDYKRGGPVHDPEACPDPEFGSDRPIQCNALRPLLNYLSRIYGVEYIFERYAPPDSSGTGGVGADNRPSDGYRLTGLRLVRDRNGFPIKGFDFRYAWHFDPIEQDKPMNVDPPETDDFWASVRFALAMANMIDKRVKVIGLTESQGRELGEQLAFMFFSKECVKAFRKAGLSTPAEIIRDRGWVFGSAGLLISDNNNVSLGITSARRRELVQHRRVGSDGFTDNRGDGPVYTFFNFWATPSFSFGETVTHETIHGANVGIHYSLWSTPFPFYGHDLSGYEHYESIRENCTPREAQR